MESDLLKELLEASFDNATILSNEAGKKIIKTFNSCAPFNRVGSRIDWQNIQKHLVVKSEHNMLTSLNKLLNTSIVNDEVYVLWNDASLPVIKTDIQSIVNHFDKMLCVSFETWLYNPDLNYVIECSHTGVITMGCL